MRTVNCIVVHDNLKTICNITVITRNNNPICLLYNPDTTLRYKYRNLTEIYDSVLNILKNNDFKVACEDYENSKLYNIQWIDCNHPCEVNRYFYKGKGV